MIDKFRQLLNDALPYEDDAVFSCSETKKGYSGVVGLQRSKGC